MSWTSLSLGEVASFSQGLQVSTKNQFLEKDDFCVRFIRIVDYTSDSEPPRYINVDNYEKYFVEENDIVMIRYGSQTAGKVARGIRGVIANNTFKIKINQPDINQNYLFHYLNQVQIYNRLNANQASSTMPAVSFGMVKNLNIPIPPLQTQKRIADILSAYDDLIENNLKRIKLLEQAAQNIYKEWFVNLRFPGHENTPINEETGLPVGWEVCTINDVCEKVASGGTPSRRNKSYWDNPKYPWVTTKELRDGFILDVKESVSEEGLKNSSAKLFPKGTILMAIYASPTLGRLGILSREACCNQAAVGFICNNTKISNQFLYYTLYSERANLNAIAIGAAQQNINVGKVKAHEIILPPFHFVERFTSITSSNYEMRLNLVTQNQKLKAARDILLPRLMNRTIEV